MKISTAICFALFLGGVLAFLSQMWFHTWPPELFLKIIITDGAFFVVSFIYVFLIKESRQSDKIKHGNSSLD